MPSLSVFIPAAKRHARRAILLLLVLALVIQVAGLARPQPAEAAPPFSGSSPLARLGEAYWVARYTVLGMLSERTSGRDPPFWPASYTVPHSVRPRSLACCSRYR